MAFQGEEDHFRGVTIDSSSFSKEQIEGFELELKKVIFYDIFLDFSWNFYPGKSMEFENFWDTVVGPNNEPLHFSEFRYFAKVRYFSIFTKSHKNYDLITVFSELEVIL